MKRLHWVIIAIITAALAACGGGTVDEAEMAPIPSASASAVTEAATPPVVQALAVPVLVAVTPQPTVAVTPQPAFPTPVGPLPTVAASGPADVTLEQTATNLVVSPGETFRLTFWKVSCPVLRGTDDICEKAVPMGELGYDVGLDLQDLKVAYNGRELSGYFIREGSLYRFAPTERVELWQTGAIELTATLSPEARSGAATIVGYASDASFDKTLEFVGPVARLEVVELPYQAPAAVTAYSNMSFVYACPGTVVMGCTLNGFTFDMIGLVPNTETLLIVDGNPIWQYYPQESRLRQEIQVGYWVAPGASIIVKVAARFERDGGVWFDQVRSLSANKLIAPLLPTECTSISPRSCKG